MNTRIISIIVFTLLLSAIGSTIKAQAIKEQNYNKYTIAGHPLYLLDGGVRFDFEKQLNNDPRKWLQIYVSGYYLPNYKDNEGGYYDSGWVTLGSDGDPILSHKGFGIGAAYKYFFKLPLFYINSGVSYTYYNVSYKDSQYIKFYEDDLTFYEYRYLDNKQHFNQLSSNINLGLQTPTYRGFIFDAYMGIGYSYSFFDNEKKAFDDNMYGYGHRGLYFSGGMRLGFAFGK